MITSYRGRTKPQVGARVNTMHPLSRGLISAYLFNDGAVPGDLLNTSLPKLAPTLGTSFDGSSLITGSSSYVQGDKSFPAALINGGAYTFSFAASNLTVNAGTVAFFTVGSNNANDNVLGIRLSAATSMIWFQFSDDTTFTIPDPKNGRVHCIGSMSASKTGTYYHNGVRIGTSTITAFLNVSTRITVGAWFSGGSQPAAFEHLFFWNRSLDATEAASLYAKPYEMFYVPVNRTLVKFLADLPVTVGDSLTLSDNVLIQFVVPFLINISDSMSISDSLGNSYAGLNRPVADFISFSDLIRIAATLQIPLNDSLTISDAVQLLLQQSGLSLSDTITLSDNAIARLAAVLNIQLSDSIAFSDNINILLNTAFTSYIRRYLNDVI